MEKRIAWTITDLDGHRADVYLLMGAPTGELVITLAQGAGRWTTLITVDDIAILLAASRGIAQWICEIYLDEMVLNAKAALRPRVH